MEERGFGGAAAKSDLGSSLFRRVFPAVALVALVPLIASTVAALWLGGRAGEREATLRLRADAALMREACAGAVSRGDRESLDALVKRLGRELETRFTVIDGQGVVLADSDRDPVGLENHANRRE